MTVQQVKVVGRHNQISHSGCQNHSDWANMLRHTFAMFESVSVKVFRGLAKFEMVRHGLVRQEHAVLGCRLGCNGVEGS